MLLSKIWHSVLGWKHYQSILKPELDRVTAFSSCIAHPAPIHLPFGSSAHTLISLVIQGVMDIHWSLGKIRLFHVHYGIGQKQITLLLSERENILCATNQPNSKLFLLGCWAKLSIAAAWCKEHSKLSLLRVFMAVWQKWALWGFSMLRYNTESFGDEHRDALGWWVTTDTF